MLDMFSNRVGPDDNINLDVHEEQPSFFFGVLRVNYVNPLAWRAIHTGQKVLSRLSNVCHPGAREFGKMNLSYQ